MNRKHIVAVSHLPNNVTESAVICFLVAFAWETEPFLLTFEDICYLTLVPPSGHHPLAPRPHFFPAQCPFSRLTPRLWWANNCLVPAFRNFQPRHFIQAVACIGQVAILKSETRCSRWSRFTLVLGSSGGFPSLWATGLGRSGIGPEAGGGGRWAGGRRGKLRRRHRGHVRDAGELLCPARRSGALSWGQDSSSPSTLLLTFLESQGELLFTSGLPHNYFPSTLHWN